MNQTTLLSIHGCIRGDCGHRFARSGGGPPRSVYGPAICGPRYLRRGRKLKVSLALLNAPWSRRNATLAKLADSSVAILDVTKQQMVRVDELLNDAGIRAKVQMERAEMVLDDTMTRVQQTVSIVQRGVLSPVRGMLRDISRNSHGVFKLGRGSRPTVEHVTSDEEMFI